MKTLKCPLLHAFLYPYVAILPTTFHFVLHYQMYWADMMEDMLLTFCSRLLLSLWVTIPKYRRKPTLSWPALPTACSSSVRVMLVHAVTADICEGWHRVARAYTGHSSENKAFGGGKEVLCHHHRETFLFAFYGRYTVIFFSLCTHQCMWSGLLTRIIITPGDSS